MDKDIARTACNRSAQAYHTPLEATVLKKGTAKCILIREEGCVWIAVEGTRPKFKDWLKNLWIVKTEFYGLAVHSGCACEARALLPLIKAELRQTDVLRITGHSQGGGVALLLGWVLSIDWNVLSGHGFAPMRSISKESREAFHGALGDRWWNFARQSDIVPHLPSSRSYRRPGKDYFFNEHGRWVQGIPTFSGYMLEVWRLFRQGRLPELWADHSIGKYTSAMTKF